MRSYSLHLSCTKKPVWPNKQYQNHDQVGSNLVNARSQEGNLAFVPGSQILYQANDDSTNDSPGDRVDTSQNNSRERQQCGTAQCRIHSKGTKGKKDSAYGGDGGSYTPCQRIDCANIDTHRQRCFLVERSCTHSESIAAILKEIEEHGAQNDRHNNCQQIIRPKMDTGNVKTIRNGKWRGGRNRIRSPS